MRARYAALAPVVALAFLLVLTTPCFGEGTDPSGTVLRAYVTNYLANASPTDALAMKINAAGGIDGTGIAEWLCSLEISNTYSTGYKIWEARMQADTYYTEHSARTQYIPLNLTNYCIIYSNNFDHWKWNQNSMRTKYGQ